MRAKAAPKSVDAKRTKGSATKLKLHVPSSAGRVRISSFAKESELLKQIGETFGTIPGIERVSVNPQPKRCATLRYGSYDEFHGG